MFERTSEHVSCFYSSIFWVVPNIMVNMLLVPQQPWQCWAHNIYVLWYKPYNPRKAWAKGHNGHPSSQVGTFLSKETRIQRGTEVIIPQLLIFELRIFNYKRLQWTTTWELLVIMCQNASRNQGYHQLRIYPWISQESIMSANSPTTEYWVKA
jgi:hypothetical protein